MQHHKTINLPKAQHGLDHKKEALYNPKEQLRDEGFSFSFQFLDRDHELFNLGTESKTKEKPVESSWFLDLLDCLKEVCKSDFFDLKGTKFDLHPVNWDTANVNQPNHCFENDEIFWQFRLNKSKGRIVGVYIQRVLYIIWLDRYHNLTDSDGYRGKVFCYRPKSECEKYLEEIDQLRENLKILQEDFNAAQELLEDVVRTGSE